MSEDSRLGRYVIECELGSGAMGSVYKALDPLIERVVAIKVIRLDLLENDQDREEYRDRMIREARICGKLLHPNIVVLYDAGVHDGHPFIAMEYVEGTTLADWLAENGSLPPDLGATLVVQVSSALDLAHGHGIVHRDIKPQNIMVTPDGKAKVMDFGIARLNDAQMTKSGVILGTPRYCSPEQIRDVGVDHRTDIFSLGVLAHEIFSKTTPFSGKTINEMLFRLVQKPPALAPEILQMGTSEAEMVSIFHKVLAKEPAQRYQKASDFARDLVHALGLEAYTSPSHKLIASPARPGSQVVKKSGEDLAQLAPTVAMTAEKAEADTSARLGQRYGRKWWIRVAAATALMVFVAAVMGWTFWQPGRNQTQDVVDLNTRSVEAAKTVRVYSNPPGADIFLDGRRLGSTPLVHLWDGETHGVHLLEAHLMGFVSQVAHLQGEDIFRPMRIEMRPSEAGSEEWANTTAAEATAIQAREMDLKPGVPAEEQSAWIETRRRDNLLSYRKYLEQFPAGAYADEAQTRVTEIQTWLFFDQAKKSGKVSELGLFLERYPDSKFGREVKMEIHRLQREEAFQSAMSHATYSRLIGFLEDYDATATRDQLNRIQMTMERLDAEEDALYSTLNDDPSGIGIKTYLERYAGIHLQHTQDVEERWNALQEGRRRFLQEHVQCVSPGRRERVRRKGLEITFRIRQEPGFSLTSCWAQWRIDNRSWTRLELNYNGTEFQARLDKEDLEEGSFQIRFCAEDELDIEYRLEPTSSRLNL